MKTLFPNLPYNFHFLEVPHIHGTFYRHNFLKSRTIFKISTFQYCGGSVFSLSDEISPLPDEESWVIFVWREEKFWPFVASSLFLVNFCNVVYFSQSTFSWFIAITCHNKQMSVALITLSAKIWMAFVVYSDCSCQQRDKLYEKMFFSKLMQQSFSIFLSFFIIMNVDLEIFIKTHVLLYFYNETKSSHQRCSIKKLFLKTSNLTRKHLYWSLF